MKYYKDRNFPEIKVSNSDIVAVIEDPKQLKRVIDEHNELEERVYVLEKALSKAIGNLQVAIEMTSFDDEEDQGIVADLLDGLRSALKGNK